MTRRRRTEDGEEGDAGNQDAEGVRLPALEDGRVQEDRIIGQELATMPAAAAASADLTQFSAVAPAILDEAEGRTGDRGLVQTERPRPEDVPVPASPFQTPGASTVLRRLEQGPRTPMSYPQGRPRSLFPLFTEEQLTSMEKSQQGASHLYGQKSLTEPRPLQMPQMPSPEEMMRSYAQKRDGEQEVLWKMLQEARMEADVLRHRNEVLTAEIQNYEKLVAELQFRTPQGSREGGSENGMKMTSETAPKEPVAEDGAASSKEAGNLKKGDKDDDSRGKASTSEDQMQTTMQVMLSLMQSMQEMQKRLLDTKSESKEEDREDVEWVRGGTVTLPQLPEW